MTFSARQYPCSKGCGGFGVHVCAADWSVDASFKPPSTTGYPESSGPCGRCGGPTYIGVTHFCPTAVLPPFPIIEPFKPFEFVQPLYHTVPDASGICTLPCPACAAGVPLQREPVRWKPKPCGKCTSQDARIYFHVGSYNTAGADKPGCGRYDQTQRDKQHLHVYCQVCHFDWTESLPRKS